MRMEAFKNQYIAVAEFIFRKTSVCYYLKNCGEALKFLYFLSLGRVATEWKHIEEKAMESMNELIP